MSENELQNQIDDGVQFWCYPDKKKINGVMGIQEESEVTLIRNAYVKTMARNKGMGGKRLDHLSKLTIKPILIGTWADATRAIHVYKKHGFSLTSYENKDCLLRRDRTISLRQIETSVVFTGNECCL